MPAAKKISPPEPDTFEVLYLQQRKKSQLLLIAVVVLAIATASSLAWGFSKSSSPQSTQSGFPGSMNGQQGGPGGMQGPGGGMRGMMDVTQFFKDDGSVDTDAVDSFMSRMPSGREGSPGSGSFNFLDRFKETINQAAEDGDITEEQATALIKAFESESSTNES